MLTRREKNVTLCEFGLHAHIYSGKFRPPFSNSPVFSFRHSQCFSLSPSFPPHQVCVYICRSGWPSFTTQTGLTMCECVGRWLDRNGNAAKAVLVIPFKNPSAKASYVRVASRSFFKFATLNFLVFRNLCEDGPWHGRRGSNGIELPFLGDW